MMTVIGRRYAGNVKISLSNNVQSARCTVTNGPQSREARLLAKNVQRPAAGNFDKLGPAEANQSQTANRCCSSLVMLDNWSNYVYVTGLVLLRNSPSVRALNFSIEHYVPSYAELRRSSCRNLLRSPQLAPGESPQVLWC